MRKNGPLFILVLLTLTGTSKAQMSRRNFQHLVPDRETNQRLATSIEGERHTLCIRNGQLLAWGFNSKGQLGLGNTSNPVATPTKVGNRNKWVSIATGTMFSAGIQADGSLWTWGDNTYGQLGNGTTTPSAQPVMVGTGHQWIAVACGEGHVLALQANGTIWGWGKNDKGQAGVYPLNNVLSPTPLANDAGNWVSISAGKSHNLALKANGKLYAWGSNHFGQLGIGQSWENLSNPYPVAASYPFRLISAGGEFSLAVATNGSVATWGGSVGVISTPQYFNFGISATNTNIISISAGAAHSYCTLADGKTYGWGYNNSRQINSTFTNYFSTPQDLLTSGLVLAGVSSGYLTKADGSIWSRGSGYLGLGKMSVDTFWTQVLTPDTNWSMVAAGSIASIGLVNGSRVAWGNNSNGQFGVLSPSNSLTPQAISSFGGYISMALGSNHGVAISATGGLVTWGSNQSGQLGTGNFVEILTPGQISSEKKWISVSAGDRFTLALKSDGTLWGCGLNRDNQLNQFDTARSNVLVEVWPGQVWKSVSCGKSHVLAIRDDGTLWTWGKNNFGQLGVGNSNVNNFLNQIGTDTDWFLVSAGDYHSVAQKSNGRIYSWGKNTDGQLGLGDNVLQTSPVQMGLDSTWILVMAGENHTVGLKSNGTLWAWGDNTFGQLGNGNNTDQNQPQQSGTDNNWTFVDAGNNYTIGLKAGYQGFCGFGSNMEGQLGNNSTQNQTSAVCANACFAPAVPNASDKSICPGETVVLSAAGSGVLSWFTEPIGGTPLGTGPTFTTPVLTSTTEYYVQDSTCTVGSRKMITVTVKPQPNVTISSVGVPACAGQTVKLTATGTSNLSWSGGISNGVSFIPTESGTYTVIGTGLNGCKDTASIFVAVNPIPSVGFNASGTTVCAGTPVTLNGTGAITYSWTGGATNGVPFTPTQSSRYIVTGTANNCSDTASVYITVNSLPNVTVNATALIVCTGEQVTLTASGAASYSWNGGITNGVAFVPAQTTTYTVTGTGANNCTTTVSRTVTVNAVPVVGVIASATRLCAGTSLTLNGTGALSYSWSGGVSNGVPFTPSQSARYLVTGTNGLNCSDTASIYITVNSLPVVGTIVTTSPVCSGLPVTLTGTGAATYIWSGGVINGLPFIPLQTATYFVTGTDANNCQNTASATVIVNPHPDTATTLSGATLSASQSGASYQWYSCGSVPALIAGATNQSYTAVVPGFYRAEITWNGCMLASSCKFVNITETNGSLQNPIRSFPNPVDRRVTFDLQEQNGLARVELTDMLGKSLAVQQVGLVDGRFTLDLGEMNLPGGAYIVRVSSAVKQYMLRIVKE